MTGIFIKVLEMSAAASIVITVLMLLRLIFRKAPRIFSYAMWAAALFRLLCPITFELASAPVPQIEIAYTEAAGTAYANDLFTAPAKPDALLAAASYLWAAAVTAMLFRGLISWKRLSHSLGSAQKMGDSIYVSSTISNPFIMGLIRPRIYLPTGLTCGESRLIIMHERTHMKRGDHIAKLVMYLALCIHCFNPLVWIMSGLFERDMEMSCDETVTANMDSVQKADYSQTLLKISSKPTAAFTACFGENGTKQRIKNVLSFKKPAVWVIIVLAIAAAAVSFILCADRKKPVIDENADFLQMLQDTDTPHVWEGKVESTELMSIPAIGINGTEGYMTLRDYYGGPDNEERYGVSEELITDEWDIKDLRERYYSQYGEEINNYTFYCQHVLIPLYDETGENVTDHFHNRCGIRLVPPDEGNHGNDD